MILILVINQKCTIVNEKYAVLDNSNCAVHMMNCKWLTNYKDGHSILVPDPQVTQVLFRKIKNSWRVINIVDSNVEKNVPSESPQRT